MESIPLSDAATIDRHELTNIRVFPELNERLYLCFCAGKNVAPLRDLYFDRPMSDDYMPYVELIAGSDTSLVDEY
jgi:hypothetical protein